MLAKTEEAEAIRPPQQIPVETDNLAGSSKTSPPPPPPLPRDDKQPRHISFLDETANEKTKRDYVPVDPPKPRGKNARWTLAVLPGGRSAVGASKLGRTRLLNTIVQASSSSSAIDSLEHPEPPPPPPPLPPTPPFWQAVKPPPPPPSPPPRPLVPPPRPPAPNFAAGFSNMRRKKMSRRAMTMRPEDSPSSVPETDVPYRPVQHFRSMIKQPWHHRSGCDLAQQSQPSLPPTSKFSRQTTGPTVAAVPSRRFSRQNTIQVVSDVQGVLSDILRDIVPGNSKSSSGNRSASSKPLIAAKSAVTHPSAASVDYGNKHRG